MNKRRIRRLARILRKDPLGRVPKRLEKAGFSMSHFLRIDGKTPHHEDNMLNAIPKHGCGTVGCIGGWTVLLWGDPKAPTTTPVYQLLDLSMSETDALMMPPFWSKPERYPRERCAAMLDNLADTGKIDWNIDWNKSS